MNRKILLFLFFLQTTISLYSADIKGKVYDYSTREVLVGSTVFIKELNKGTISGLDGSFLLKNIPEGSYTISCRYVGYLMTEKKITITENINIDFTLTWQTSELDEITVTAQRERSTDLSARTTEKTSIQLMNVISAKTIELSPDMNIANALQRMSGITLDKGSSNAGQYALLRGMDKRYNYTLVNGIKIPSTSNKYRYVSLDMFPSDMVDRIEVTKALTPDMEGDAIAGVVNLIMKNAPEKRIVQLNFSTGFNQFFLKNEFSTFNSRNINPQSPYERNNKGYFAIPADFPSGNLSIKPIESPINLSGNITVGNRFSNKKMGWILSGSYQKNYTGEGNLYFSDNLSRDGNNLPVLTGMQERTYNEIKRNIGIHNKLDWQLNSNNNLELYIAFLELSNSQLRQVQKTDLAVSYDPEAGDINRSFSSRFRLNKQTLFNATLQGSHILNKKLTARWSVVFSEATNQTPDEATISFGNSTANFIPVKQYIDFDGSGRIWRHNSDQDLAGYLNFNYTPVIFGLQTEIIAGGMYRQKNRTSFYNKYILNAIVNVNNADTSYTSFYSEKGVDWNSYDEITWKVYNPRGTVAVGENYDAGENVIAGYSMFRISKNKLQITGGVRIENTEQDYYMQYPIGEPEPKGIQKYTDILPSIHFKYSRIPSRNIRVSYYRAINKPGFQEIVPYIDSSDEPVSAGNKYLKHAIADNLDLRWELFPSPLDQIMAGLFYKKISNAIEFAFEKFMNVSQNIVYTPINSEKAINYGFEVDITRYYREFGFKGNVTMTRSNITTKKLSRVKDSNGNDSTAYVFQSRPLFGQSAVVGNVSLLYKSSQNGINGQLAFSYTGDRIYTVSRYIDNDLWQKGFWQLDVSGEKTFKNGIGVFVKVNNLLNTHVKVYIKKTNPMNGDVPFHSISDKSTLVRDEYSKPSYLAGIRYKF